MMSFRDEIEARFKREFPKDRAILLIDGANNKIISLHRDFTIGTLLEHLRAERVVILDLEHDRVFDLEEVTVSEFLLQLEITNNEAN